MRLHAHILLAILACLMAACGTGVETGKRVTERDVQRIVGTTATSGTPFSVHYADSVPAWALGKRFYVTDDNARLMFEHSRAFDRDTLRLAGRYLIYKGCDTVTSLDGRRVVNLLFDDGPRRLVYRTTKSPGEFTSSFVVPFLVNMDMVDYYRRALVGREYYVTTPIWYDITNEEMKRGRKFIKVTIDEVAPGNKVLPLKVIFTAHDDRERALVWLSSGNELMNNRTFDALFAETDPRLSYSHISDAHWQLIVKGKVTEGMTKEECRLALGAPRSITQLPDQTGLREVWSYDGGITLRFVDGLLVNQ